MGIATTPGPMMTNFAKSRFPDLAPQTKQSPKTTQLPWVILGLCLTYLLILMMNQ
jgi:hypothetical protein